jgi:hypothetical protein
MLNSGTLIAVRCRISRGGFSSERVFRVTMASGVEHVTAGPVEYFFDENQQRLQADQPPRGVTLAGYVTARVVEQKNDTVLVSVPSGEVLWLGMNEIVEHPKGIRAHVPVQS